MKSRKKSKVLPAWLLALGRNSLPEQIIVEQKQYRLQKLYKHDFWAATGLYSNGARLVVLKVYRLQDLLGLPMAWVGRWLANREIFFYNYLQDLPDISRFSGRIGETGFVHDYIRGQTLLESDGGQLTDDFFDQLRDLMLSLHVRGVSYVDANKRDNVIVGEDGRPHLIDFQICWHPKGRSLTGLSRRAFHLMQRVDLYHVFKHKSRMRPELMRPQEWQMVNKPSFFTRIHRFLTAPFRDMRRTTLRRLK